MFTTRHCTARQNSLPDRELNSGVAEIIKYGLIRDPELFAWLEANIEKVRAGQ